MMLLVGLGDPGIVEKVNFHELADIPKLLPCLSRCMREKDVQKHLRNLMQAGW